MCYISFMRQKFGENFQDNLLKYYDEASLEESKKFLTEYLECNGLEGINFLDAGCGSGAFSLAALQLGAIVTSFDIDRVCLENVQAMLERFKGDKDRIQIKQGSILDGEFLNSLGTFDVVLCWGVAHHCGDMWRSIDLISKRVKPDGLIHLGIYNHADGWGFYPDGRFGPSSFWRKVKRFYVSMPGLFQHIFETACVAGISVVYLLSFNNPVKKLKSNERRGMNWQSDLKDWLLGYPYESATPGEVFEFMKKRGFALRKMNTNNGLLTNNFVFVKTSLQRGF